MVLTAEIMMMPPRRNSLSATDTASRSPSKSTWWFLTSKLNLKPVNSIHTVATQKLRESKWFNQDEERLFCAVIESGFIVEIMANEQSITESKSHYGVVSVEAKKSKKPTAKDIFVYTVNKCDTNRLKVIKLTVADLWTQNYKLRINNINDKNQKPNAEKEIKSQVNYAIKHKVAFHNSLHFVEFCRYGEQVELRKRQVSESVKWGTVGMNAGIFLLQREKSHSFSK